MHVLRSNVQYSIFALPAYALFTTATIQHPVHKCEGYKKRKISNSTECTDRQ